MRRRRLWVAMQGTRQAILTLTQCRRWATRHILSIILLPQKTDRVDLSEVHRDRNLLIMMTILTMITVKFPSRHHHLRLCNHHHHHRRRRHLQTMQRRTLCSKS